MKPPADRQLDTTGAGTDVQVTAVRYGVRWRVVFLVATLLGAVSSLMAWNFTRSMPAIEPPWSWWMLIVLNYTYWYIWAVFAPAVIWLSQHFRFERHGLLRALAVHLPAVVVFSLTHIALLQGMHWWLAVSQRQPFAWWAEVRRGALLNFDWEMMTYWAIVGISHAVLYYRESRERAVRASQLETQLVEARLATLQQQLHPHFLFNTLHAISALMHRDVDAADRMLMRLSDLLRMTLDNIGQQEVTLESELEFLGKYLDIERTRFADRLSVRLDVQPETLDILVPRLLLQPLVENAIKHGVARQAGPGHIDITARRSNDKLWIEVRDDGAGLSETALNALQKGIGVSTTRARLQHQFGAEYRFEFHRLPQGLAVVVAIPWRRAEPGAMHATEPGAVSRPTAGRPLWSWKTS
ncbi:MAG: histidine kinase [Acidobacteria bacterium]|nr:histidine kinase [Acidobacteriota bacterium]MBA3887078.1 histidine kinase [Acidobacteriota bacterium]